MKRLLYVLSALTFVLIFSSNTFAQVTASATIVENITVTTNEDLSFGQINNSQSTDAIIDPNGTNSNTGATTTLGKVTVGASTGSSIGISFTNPATLDDGAGNTITFTGNYTGSETDDPSGSGDLNEGSTNNVILTGDTYYIYLGGTLAGADITGTPAGTYQGTISVNVTYL